MAKYLNAGCGTHYAKGWVNTDVWEDELTKPDVVVKPGEPYPFGDNTFDAVYMGHVLEHISWSEVPAFLEEIKRISKPGARLLIVGPDVLKTIDRWAKKQEPWDMVLSVMEHQDINTQPGREHHWWDGATHHWNCHHERVWNLLTACGLKNVEDMYEQIPNNALGTSWHDKENNITWPVVGKYYWQFAIACTN